MMQDKGEERKTGWMMEEKARKVKGETTKRSKLVETVVEEV